MLYTYMQMLGAAGVESTHKESVRSATVFLWVLVSARPLSFTNSSSSEQTPSWQAALDSGMLLCGLP